MQWFPNVYLPKCMSILNQNKIIEAQPSSKRMKNTNKQMVELVRIQGENKFNNNNWNCKQWTSLFWYEIDECKWFDSMY